jgi:protein-S-isoprenylcysteine O-methyltransferase Ste14
MAFALTGLAVLLLGWGFDDPAGFFRHPARTGMLGVALLGLVLSRVLKLDIDMFRRSKKPVGRQKYFLMAIMPVSLFLVWLLPHGDRHAWLTFDADWLRYLGLGLNTLGMSVLLAALHNLGRQYSGYVTLQEDHKLVQHGVYGVIRHPIYLRALLSGVGTPLIFRSWLVFPMLALAMVFVGFRIRQEEKLLAEEFGEEFEAYRRRTWRLIPFVY